MALVNAEAQEIFTSIRLSDLTLRLKKRNPFQKGTFSRANLTLKSLLVN